MTLPIIIKPKTSALNPHSSAPIDPTKPESSSSALNLSSARNSAVAGYAAGVVGVVLGHPLDSLKVWAQTSSSGMLNKHVALSPAGSSIGTSKSSGSTSSRVTSSMGLSRPTPRSIGTASMSTLAGQAATPGTSSNVLRTIRALYSGASGPLLTVGMVQSINFSTYDAVRRYLHDRDHPQASRDEYLHKDSLQNVAIAGFVAGTGLAFVTSPLVMIKTQQQITGNGFQRAFRDTFYRSNGQLNMRKCFVGFGPHLMGETCGRALYYTVYEACKRQIAAHNAEQGSDASVSLMERMGAAASAGIVCWSAIFPLDALRNRLYSQAGRGVLNPLSTWDMARTMYHERSLYRGFSLTVLRAGPVAAAVLPVYDLVLERLSSQ